MRRIAVVTGTRAEYGLLYPVMKAIEQQPDLELLVVVTGMHLAKEFGSTYQEIERDGFKIEAKVDMLLSSDTGGAQAKSIGLGIIGLTQALERLSPDIILILGDRGEPFAAAVAGVHLNIPVAHIHGGDSSWGGFDEYIRHAITKLALIHFPATKKSAQRIRRLGENPQHIYTVGAPGLDTILRYELIPHQVVLERFGLNLEQPILLVVQHPVTTQIDEASFQIQETMEAIKELKYETVLVYPNADAGSRRMIEVIERYRGLPYLKIEKNLSHLEYLSLMKIAKVQVGNSSSGIIEAPSFSLAVVNIGSRQKGRERAENMIDVSHKKDEIVEAIRFALSNEEFKERLVRCKNPYGDGRAGERIAEILRRIEINPELLKKKITY